MEGFLVIGSYFGGLVLGSAYGRYGENVRSFFSVSLALSRSPHTMAN
jgi:hypothetical protein